MKIYFAGASPGSNTHALCSFFADKGHEVFTDVAGERIYDIAFTNNGRLLEKVRAKLKVNTQHGNLFLGDTNPEPQYGIQLALAASESEKQMMVRNGFRPQDVLVTGQPRMDRLFERRNSTELAQDFLISKDLGSHLITVLYAPTYSRGAFGMGEKLFLASSINKGDDVHGVNSFVGACEEKKRNLIIRLHKYQKRFFGRLIPGYLTDVLENVEVHDNEIEPDSLPVLLAADILVTDFSSITADFLALSKPIVFIEPHSGWKYTEQWHASKRERFDMGAVAYNQEELAELIRMPLAELKRLTEATGCRDAAEKYQPYFDGQCCRRVYNALMS